MLGDDALDEALDKAINFAIGLQEAAGIDIISDGEWRRIGYFEVFARWSMAFNKRNIRRKRLRLKCCLIPACPRRSNGP